MAKCTCTIAVFLGLVVSLFFSTASAGEMVPLKGRWERDQGQFSGNLTHFGTWNQVGPPFVWEGANGDTVTITYTPWDFVVIAPGVLEYTHTFTIIAGTGRFENATGSGTVTGTANFVTDYWFGTVDGMISRPNSGKK